MYKKKVKKSIVAVGAMMLALGGVFCIGNSILTRNVEAQVLESSNVTLTEDGVQADYVISKVSMDFAEYIVLEMSEVPLLDEYVTTPEHYGDSSLEAYVDDVNATKWSKNMILIVCEEEGLDVAKATVKDLTVEQIARIDQETFENSTHSKSE